MLAACSWSSAEGCGSGGAAPFRFVSVPEDESAELKSTAALVTYGWGMVPVEVRIGETRWTTSLWPQNGGTSCR